MNIEHLVLKGTAIREHLNAADEAFNEHFVKPVREWLFSKPGGVAEVMGIAKPCIQISKDKEVLDDNRIMEDIRALVKGGAISDAELRVMVQDGTFMLATPELVVDNVAAKMKKSPAAYKILVPGKAGFAVRWNGINNSKDRIAAEYSRLAEASEKVVDAAADELDAETLKRMTGV